MTDRTTDQPTDQPTNKPINQQTDMRVNKGKLLFQKKQIQVITNLIVWQRQGHGNERTALRSSFSMNEWNAKKGMLTKAVFLSFTIEIINEEADALIH